MFLVTNKAALASAAARRHATLQALAQQKRLPVTAEDPLQAEARAERRALRAKRRVLHSSLVQELQAEMDEAPEHVMDCQEARGNCAIYKAFKKADF